MNTPIWSYAVSPLVLFLAVFAVLLSASFIGYRIGVWNRKRASSPTVSDFVPSTILGLLALILAFTFSMTATRFENRRQLVVSESNRISTTHSISELLPWTRQGEISSLLRSYVNARIRHYDAPMRSPRATEADAEVTRIERRIRDLTRQELHAKPTIIEANFVTSMNAMFDLKNERNILLLKTLPQAIYWNILFMAAMGLGILGFDRALRAEKGQWQPSLLALLFAMSIFMIQDLDSPTAGPIRISQDAMIALRSSLEEAAR